MADDGKRAESGREIGIRLVETATDLFAAELERALAAKGHGPAAALVAAQAAAFKGNPRLFLPPVRRILEEWLTAVERDLWDRGRKRPFERALVQRFAHLFPPMERIEDPRAASRRVLPGLMASIGRLVGEAHLEERDTLGRVVFKTVKDDRGIAFRWQDFYDDEQTRLMIDDTLVMLAQAFGDPVPRMEWLVFQINAQLAPPEPYAFEGPAVEHWSVGEPALAEILRALYHGLAVELAGDDGRRRIARRYGDEAVAPLRRLAAHLGLID